MGNLKTTINIFNVIITICTLSVFVAILVDFVLYNDKNNVKKNKKSFVATGTMILFYMLYYLVIRLKIGAFSIVEIDSSLIIFFMSIGTVCIVVGAIINILGRLELKGNWGNHIKIYEGHNFVNTGVYKIVRHPLYASIMLMLFGGSIFYFNWLSVVLVIVIFIPAMTYRAKQEEVLLMSEFVEYSEYRENVGMFFPKLFKKN